MTELFIALKFKSRYRMALLAIAFMAISAFSIMRFMLDGQADYAEIINTSGRQRMLSQRISLLYDRYNKHPEKKDLYKKELQEAITLFESSHERLIGKAKTNNFSISNELKDYYFKYNGVNDKLYAYLAHIKTNIENNTYSPYPIDKLDELLKVLNQAVFLFENESKELTQKTTNAEAVVLVLTLCLLTIEALYIFKPLNNVLRETIEKLVYEKEQAVLARQIKSRFISNMTHEIRTPLNGIIGSIQLLKQKQINPDYKEYIDIIGSCSKSTLELINSILDFEKIEANKLELYKEWHAVNQLQEDLNYQFILKAREKKLDFDIKNTLMKDTELYIDGVRIKQVLINLLTNAFKFTDTGSVTLTIAEEDSNIIFEVKDSGRGIEIKDQKLIYESFTQLYQSSRDLIQGTGLGLNITRSLVKLMGGELFLESKLNEGSTFKVVIPIEQRVQPPLSPQSNDHADTLVSKPVGHNILVLEDNSINTIIIKKYLENLGHQHIVVENGQQGLKMLAEHNFDIILCDIQMPVMNGIEFIKLCKEQELLNNCKIYAFSANASKSDLEEYSSLGFDGTIPKPVTIFDLKKILDS